VAKQIAVGPCTIANGATTSSRVLLGAGKLAGVRFPSAMTNTTLAVYGATTADGTLAAMYDDVGAAITVPVVASAHVDLGWVEISAPYIAFVGSVAEAGDRALEVVIETEV